MAESTSDELPNWAHLEAAQTCLRRAQDTLVRATVASCECMTKTPDPAYHSETCRYRRLEDALTDLRSASFALARMEPKLVQSAASADSGHGS